MNILQNIIFPNFDINAPSDLYIRTFGPAIASREHKRVDFFQKGAVCVFDTYFNSFTIQTWKNATDIRQLKLTLFGRGKFILKINKHQLHSEMQWLKEQTIELTASGTEIEFANLSDFSEGMLFFELIALTDEDTYVNGGYYHTDLAPRNEVKLGAVITHFNRKNYVLPAIQRVSDNLLQHPYYQDKIKLIVVDNSQNITQEEAKQAIIIPNQNLGGSGGFTRGLMYLEEQGDFTHCLFMDDDASCEIESICRAYALLQYAKEEKFAVAGAQLRDIFPNRLYEKGAYFNINCYPLHFDRDMHSVHDLLWAEHIHLHKPNYGGWWFFAFKIKQVKYYAFPFFVRGDDILFSLINQFLITTLNGIGVWAEDFFVKEGIWTRYLMFRAETVCNVIYNLHYSKLNLIKEFSNRYFHCLYSCNYSSAQAFNLAVHDFLAGVNTFINDMNAAKAREKLAKLPQDEKMQALNRADYDLHFPHHISKTKVRFRRLVRKLTLNYLLMPNCLMKKKNKIIFQPKHFSADLAQIYRYQKIFYEHEATRTGYIATFDKKRLLQGYIDYVKTVIKIYQEFDAAKQDFLKHKDQLTSRAFWEHVYSEKDK